MLIKSEIFGAKSILTLPLNNRKELINHWSKVQCKVLV